MKNNISSKFRRTKISNNNIIGIMASDGTAWQRNVIKKMNSSKKDYFIFWNSKKPSGTKDTLEQLRDQLNRNGYFLIFWKQKEKVEYMTTVIDFVTNQKELTERKWHSKKENICDFFENFSEYKDSNKRASILFLTKEINEINESINDFKFFKDFKKPTQDNLTPLVSCPKSIINNKIKNTKVMVKNLAQNLILFGPPGTGKTYNAIPRALNIIDDSFEIKDTYSSEEWKKLKTQFDKYRKNGQIEFITFHQSMSYEDFVEGIKPISPKENEGLHYEVVPGIFRRICDAASGGKEISFDRAYDLFIEELTTKGYIELKTASTQNPFIVKRNSVGNCTVQAKTEKANEMTMTKDTIVRFLKNPDDRYWRTYAKPIFDYIAQNYYNFDDQSQNKNFVLIIDEINRGNVSAIFGELITLLEPAKRVGRSEHLIIKLPYSKTDFEVPPNLYIIGTMNTADRSIEALDTALRRRFSFVEMPPRYELIDLKHELGGIALSKILETINKRIEKLIDRDHLIGHSYFLNVKTWEDLLETFYKNIIPLLQEYFFGDYAKIGAVLGKGFARNKVKDLSNTDVVFADFDGFDTDDFAEKMVYEIIDYTNSTVKHTVTKNENSIEMDFQKAIKELVNLP